ncbi:hypothetical protein [Streptomyces sp. cg36]|uniref:hypothetical protein n=1 Tax=Streptomyces sp. cg36 TaxID=3238798 RepID=UPI0034E24411
MSDVLDHQLAERIHAFRELIDRKAKIDAARKAGHRVPRAELAAYLTRRAEVYQAAAERGVHPEAALAARKAAADRDRFLDHHAHAPAQTEGVRS